MRPRFRARVSSTVGSLVGALLLLASSIGAQQGGTVTGRVLDARNGQPIPSVQIFIRSLDLGGLTQQNGRYLLQNVPAGTHMLGVARIGYRTTEVQISVGGGQTVEQNFAIAEEALALDEIIVTGTAGGMQRRAIGNTVTTIDVSSITADVAITNFQDLLSGRTTGLQFEQLSGNVGTGSPLFIRGHGSLALDAAPLLYVDGVRVNSHHAGPALGNGSAQTIDDFNPEDIESIEIIKGPAAATLYGTEASAGVIQIITKRGSEGAPQFNVSIRQGVNFMTDPAGRLGTQWTCPTDPGPGPSDCQLESELVSYNMYDEATDYIAAVRADPTAIGFEWPTENLFQNGHTQAYNVDVRGGAGSTRYFMSANYENEEGAVWFNVDETLRLRANVSVVFSDQFSLDLSTGYVDGYTRFAMATQGDGGIWQDLIWSNGYFLNRVNPGANDRLLGFQEHLPTDVEDIEATRDYTRFTGSATLRHSYGGWLNQRVVIGIDKGFDTNRNLFPLEAGHLDLNGNPQPVYSETVNGEMAYDRSIVTVTSFDYSVTADYDLNENFSFGTSFGAQYYVDQFDGFFNFGSGFASPLSRTINQLATEQIRTDYALDENKSLGFFIQEQVGYRDRLFVTGSLRFDDNSTFGVDSPTQTYPNAQATWVLSEESFWGISALNSFRLRGAWGKAGRQPFSTANENIYTVIPGPGGQAAVRVAQAGNPAIEPEVSTEFEVGMDFALFEDRISGEFTHFWRKDENLLMGQSVLSSRGFPGGTQQNVGRLDSWGWEAQLSLAIYRGNGISFDLDLAADYKNNEIKDIGTLSRFHWLGRPFPSAGTGDLITSAQFDDAGDRTNAFGRTMSAMCDSGVSLAPADLTDPVEIDKYDVVPGGPPMPCGDIPNVVLTLGPAFATHTFRIAPRLTLFDNTLQFTALAEGLYGAWEGEFAIGASHFYNNTRVSRLENDPVWVYGNQIGDATVRSLYKNNFWKLREISARYTLPESIVGRTGAERASLAVSVRNLYTLYRSQSKISGGKISDPEFGGRSWEMPPLASVSVTLRVTF